MLETFKDYIKTINEPLDVNLEIPHIAYIEAKKKNRRILLFKNPIDRSINKKYDIPVLMNIFANNEVLEKIFGDSLDNIAKRVEDTIKIKPPKTVFDKINMLNTLLRMRNIFPKRLRKKGICQEKEIDSLYDIPILKTWPDDGGKFITMGQVYTHSINGKTDNVGMYRLQVYDNKKLGMHWQIHKDSNHIFYEYKKANKKMPVSIAIGGDPLYTWCATAPMPKDIFELLLYGFIRGKRALLVKSITNNIYVPDDADIIIEGFVDTTQELTEGMFGDHTGYYTPKEPYPYLEVSKITAKKNPIYYATVVGKPPLEDKYMGLATEKIFLPLIKTAAPNLIDYKMPENGVFHNLIICKINPQYPGHSLQIMHSLWGNGQMSFVKHAIFVSKDAPNLENYKSLAVYILNRLNPDNFLITKGILDALDHSSDEPFVGGKLGIDATGSKVEKKIEILSDNELFIKLHNLDNSIISVKQYCIESANPVTIIQFNKTKPAKIVFNKIKSMKNYISIAVFIDTNHNDIQNPYMLVWRIVNNIDALRDLWIDDIIGVDATNKSKIDNFTREWPKDVVCDKNVLEKLRNIGVIEIDDETVKKFQIVD